MKQNPLYIDAKVIPPDMDYQWVAKKVLGRPNDQLEKMLRWGWSPVPRSRHPEMQSVSKRHIATRQFVLLEREAAMSREAARLGLW